MISAESENNENIKRTKDVLIEEQIDFASLLLSEKILIGLKGCEFKKPSPIQLKAIPLGKCGFDLIVKSKSGTGKTAVFGIVALEMIDVSKNKPQVLILAPTREIAYQICDVIKAIGVNFDGLKVECFIGGLPLEEDIKKLEKCNIAVGAPGRIKHLIDLGNLTTDYIKLFVLDEADKLMENSFQSDINKIYYKLPSRKQMLAVSATYPDDLDQFLAKYMQTPTFISPNVETPLLLGLKQFVSVVKANQSVIQQMNVKTAEIIRVLSKVSFTQCLIFSNFQSRAESVCNILNGKGWKSTFISSAQKQNDRLKALQELKDFESRIMFSTDLTARGIDAVNVDLVINMDVPHDASTYLHRMGRAGRYGAKGICVTIALKGKELEQFLNILGMIGGTDLSIPKLPDDDSFPSNLWESEVALFEQIHGVIDADCKDEKSTRLKNIKQSLMDLKRNQSNDKNNKGDTDINDSEGSSPTTENSDDSIISSECAQKETNVETSKSIDNEVGDVLEKVANNVASQESRKSIDNEVSNILELLARGETINEATNLSETFTQSETFDTTSILNSLKEDFDSNKRKRPGTKSPSSSKSNEVIQQEKRKPNNESIYQRNLILLNSSKLLDNQNLSEEDQQSFNENIQSYLSELKNNSSYDELSQHSCLEILKNVQNFMETEGDIEDLFVYGYNYFVKPNEKHWLEKLGEEFDEDKVTDTVETINLLDSSNCDEADWQDEVYYEEEFYQEEECYEPTSKKKSVGKLPDRNFVDTNSGQLEMNHEYANNSTFNKFYDQCSDMLENQAFECEDMSSFNECFKQWQQQVASVRDYVQQNIYLSEMNRYQYYQ